MRNVTHGSQTARGQVPLPALKGPADGANRKKEAS